ncbi:patatin-domain-containing protein, partial [Testicularia cyperi]
MSSLFRRRQQPNPASLSSQPNPVAAASSARKSQTRLMASPSPTLSSSHEKAPGSSTSNSRRSRFTSQHSSSSTSSAAKRRRSLGDILSPNFYSSKSPAVEKLNPLLTADYVVPEHIDAFREALAQDLGQQEYNPPAQSSQITGSSAWNVFGYGNSLKSPEPGQQANKAGSYGGSDIPDPRSPTPGMTEPSATQVANPRKIGRIAAASDFAPIREKINRKGRKNGGVDSGTREGFVYHTLRWPLLIGIFVVISLEFLAYVLVRQLVNVIEYSIAWRGKKGQLRKRMRGALTYPEWKEAALAQDEFLGYEKWKTTDGSGFYDWILVKKVKASLKAFREKDDVENLLGVLDLCLRNNFAGTENFRLYSETYLGTKYLVESYLAEIETALAYIQNTDKVPLETKRSFYRTVAKNLGRSALCLSGGASFGYYHIGVVRALLDSNLLPKVVTGTSAGGLIAALTCTRTDEELKGMLVPAMADRITACEEPFSVWARRAWSTGARFDTVQWAEKASFFTMGSMTFKEAYERTGKILCISVIPADRHSPVKLLNYVTAPDCVIWSSLLASAAVPGILNPVCLMQKQRSTGKIVPWNWGHRFKDGSLRVDIPLQDLHALFNVNYPIVSQVNPHVHLFHFGSKGSPGRPTAHRKGKGWRGGFILSASERILKLHLKMNFKILRDLDLLPAILGQDWSSVFLQRFGGAVTILPKTRAWDWVRILSDPDRKELSRMMRVGASVTFPKIHMIENRVRLEKAIEQGRKTCRRAARAAANANNITNAGNGNKGTTAALSATAGGLADGLSAPTDTDADDFFSARDSAAPRGLTKVAGSQSDMAALRRHLNLDSSAVGTPASLVATLAGGTAAPKERPKPYPSYSRYLMDAEETNGGRDADGRASSSFARTSNDSFGNDEDEDEQQRAVDSQMPFFSATLSGSGAAAGRQPHNHGRKGSSASGSGNVAGHRQHRHASWDDRSQDFNDEDDEHLDPSASS